MTEPVKAYEFLEQGANEMRKRKEVYDPDKDSDGERSMAKTVEVFNALTGHELSEEQGWMFMVCLKMVRSQSGQYQADDYVDGAAYVGLAGECARKNRAKGVVGKLTAEDLNCFHCGDSLVGQPAVITRKIDENNETEKIALCISCQRKIFYKEQNLNSEETPFVNKGDTLEQSARMEEEAVADEAVKDGGTD